MAKNVVKQLKEDGKVTRGWLGVMIQKVNQDLADQFHMERPIGALVGEVAPDGPADKAGIKSGDIIVEYGDREISQMNMLPALVAQTAVGKKVAVTFFRDGKKQTLTVEIGKLKEDEFLEDGAESESRLGITVQDLTPDLAKSLEIEEASGILVTEVAMDSPASRAGLRRGDLILEINRNKVDNVKGFSEILKKTKKEGRLLCLVKRGNHARYVVLKTE